jgi:hypothetical protein
VPVAVEVRIDWDPGAVTAWVRSPGGQPAQILDRAASRVLQEMKRRCPVSKVQPVYATKGKTVKGGTRYAGDFPLRPSGYLRRSCRKQLEPDASQIIGPTAPYGLYVNNGTPPHIIRSTGPWPLRNRATGQVFGRVVNHPGTKPNPFITESLSVLTGTLL